MELDKSVLYTGGQPNAFVYRRTLPVYRCVIFTDRDAVRINGLQSPTQMDWKIHNLTKDDFFSLSSGSNKFLDLIASSAVISRRYYRRIFFC